LESHADQSTFPLSTTAQVAKNFGVSVWTVRQWTKQGLLRGHYQILSGRTCRLVYTNKDLVKFFDENFPSDEEVRSPGRPGNLKAIAVRKILAFNRLYHRRRGPK
jgi:hypothetical protein